MLRSLLKYRFFFFANILKVGFIGLVGQKTCFLEKFSNQGRRSNRMPAKKYRLPLIFHRSVNDVSSNFSAHIFVTSFLIVCFDFPADALLLAGIFFARIGRK